VQVPQHLGSRSLVPFPISPSGRLMRCSCASSKVGRVTLSEPINCLKCSTFGDRRTHDGPPQSGHLVRPGGTAPVRRNGRQMTGAWGPPQGEPAAASEEALLRGARAGQRAAVERLYAGHVASARRLATILAGPRAGPTSGRRSPRPAPSSTRPAPLQRWPTSRATGSRSFGTPTSRAAVPRRSPSCSGRRRPRSPRPSTRRGTGSRAPTSTTTGPRRPWGANPASGRASDSGATSGATWVVARPRRWPST